MCVMNWQAKGFCDAGHIMCRLSRALAMLFFAGFQHELGEFLARNRWRLVESLVLITTKVLQNLQLFASLDTLGNHRQIEFLAERNHCRRDSGILITVRQAAYV